MSNTRHKIRFFTAIVLLGLAGPMCTVAGSIVLAAPPTGKRLTFQHDIKPILEKKCLRCHGGEETKAGLEVSVLVNLMAGGESGPALMAGNPDESLIVELIESGEMPPEGEPLERAEAEMVRDWVLRGTFPSPDEAAALAEAGKISDEDRRFWSFVPAVKVEVPKVRNASQVVNEIDAFVLARLEQVGLRLNPRAERQKLVRRAYYGLIGLPPTTQQLNAVLTDNSPNAYGKMVDELLASRHYGERWARHWLDVAGFADTNGSLNDRIRKNSWRYRDYVIESLNANKPYDVFLRQQLAGDEMSDWRHADELTPEMFEQLTATGFLRCAPDGTENRGPNPAQGYIEKRWEVLNGQVDLMMNALLGLSFGCARCHDHKFDPITQKDYYRVQAILRPAYDPDQWIHGNIYGDGAAFLQLRYLPQAGRADETRRQAAADLLQARQLETTRLKKADNTFADEWIRILEAQGPIEVWETFEEMEKDLRNQFVSRHKLVLRAIIKTGELAHRENPSLAALTETHQRETKDLRAEIEALRARSPSEKGLIWALWDGGADGPETRLQVRGDFTNLGDPVEPGVPKVLDDPAKPFGVPQADPTGGTTGRRTAFAEWLTRPDHPLTARVLVNRVWHYHFGTGIVETTGDFGREGSPPSHPQLLDWLAVDFVEHGWDIKRLHKQILVSNVYRQSSRIESKAMSVDPGNRLLWRWSPQRLDAEVIRDGVLAVSGKLNRERYLGSPVAIKQSGDGQFAPVEFDKAGFHRSVYLHAGRERLATFLQLHDAPRIEESVAVRTRSTVPLQSLAFLNSPFIVQQSRCFAQRLCSEELQTGSERITQAFRIAFSRDPSDEELAAGLSLLELQRGGASDSVADVTATAVLCQAIFGANEFIYLD